MRKRTRLVILSLIFASLLGYAWATDRSTPTEPEGTFHGVCLELLLAFMVWIVIVLCRGKRPW